MKSFCNIFNNNRKANPKAPDFQGSLDMDREFLETMLTKLDSNGEIRCEFSGWNKEGRNGTYIQGKINPPYTGPRRSKSRDDPAGSIPF